MIHHGEGNGKAGGKDAIERGSARPKPLTVQPEGIPAELRERPQWIGWRYEQRQDKGGGRKWTKVPVGVKTGRPASSTDAGTWATCDAALAAYRRGGLDGLGFVFSPDGPFAGVDLDDCRDPATGALAGWAIALVKEFDTYGEVSPSATGAKLFLRGKVPAGGNRKDKIEVYDRGRYFAVTGVRLPGSPADVRGRQAQLDRLHARLFPPKAKAGRVSGPGERSANLSDDDLIRRAGEAANGDKFRALWDGDTTGYASDSEA